MSIPLVSVLMPAYNAAAYLSLAIDSVLSQTFTDFEFIIIDDGSVDNTEALIRGYSDARIRYLKNTVNSGIVTSLNVGLQAALGTYIARMDADDVSLPDRFEKQVAFMHANPDVGVCGGSVQTFGDIEEIWSMPLRHNDVVARMVFESCLMHPSVFIRKDVLLLNRVSYREHYKFAEDYDLWLRLFPVTKLANLPDVLLRYRVSTPKATTSSYRLKQMALSESLRADVLRDLGVSASDYELSLHNKVSFSQFDLLADQLTPLRVWFLRLASDINDQQVSKNSLEAVLIHKYYLACFHARRWSALVEYARFGYALRNFDGRRFFRLACRAIFKV